MDPTKKNKNGSYILHPDYTGPCPKCSEYIGPYPNCDQCFGCDAHFVFEPLANLVRPSGATAATGDDTDAAEINALKVALAASKAENAAQHTVLNNLLDENTAINVKYVKLKKQYNLCLDTKDVFDRKLHEAKTQLAALQSKMRIEAQLEADAEYARQLEADAEYARELARQLGTEGQ